MRSVTYHLVGAAALGLTVTSLQVVRPGRIIAVRTCFGITTGAASTAVTVSVELNNTTANSGVTNNPPRETLLSSVAVTLQSAINYNYPPSTVPLDVPVKPGDLISVNTTLGGIASTAFISSIDVIVMEA